MAIHKKGRHNRVDDSTHDPRSHTVDQQALQLVLVLRAVRLGE